MDTVDKAKRSEVMRAVKSKDTGAEMSVRRMLHGAGFRYRLHRKELPGKPDMVFVSRRKVVFIHGCFWHQHPNCEAAKRPKSNLDYWNAKLNSNLERDIKSLAALEEQGWKAFIVWECRLRDRALLLAELKAFLHEGETKILETVER